MRPSDITDKANSVINCLDGKNPANDFWRGWETLFTPEKISVAEFVLLMDELNFPIEDWLFWPMADYLTEQKPHSIHVTLLRGNAGS